MTQQRKSSGCIFIAVLLFVLVTGLVWGVLQLVGGDDPVDSHTDKAVEGPISDPPETARADPPTPEPETVRADPPEQTPRPPVEVQRPVEYPDPVRPGLIGEVVSPESNGKTPVEPIATPVLEQPLPSEGMLSVPQDGLPVRTVGAFPVSIEVRASVLSIYSEHTYYRFGAAFTNAIDDEITQLVVTLEILDRGGLPLANRDLYVVSQNAMNVRPGDMCLNGTTLETSTQAASIRLTVKTLQTQPLTREVVSSGPLTLENWPAAPGFAITVVERQRTLTPSISDAGNYMRTVFEVSNTGTVPVEVLKLAITPFGKAGDYEPYSFFPVASAAPPLLPGDTVLVSRTGSAAGDIEGYRLGVETLR